MKGCSGVWHNGKGRIRSLRTAALPVGGGSWAVIEVTRGVNMRMAANWQECFDQHAERSGIIDNRRVAKTGQNAGESLE